MRQNEDLLLIDTNKRDIWLVRNYTGSQAYIPAITVLIPGPFKMAIDMILR